MHAKRLIIVGVSYALVAAFGLLAVRTLTPVRVAGRSMHPALHSGDLVFVHKKARPRTGSIALLERPGHGPVLHRLVGKGSEDDWITRGDANPIADLEPVASDHVAGTVVAVVPVGELLERWRRP